MSWQQLSVTSRADAVSELSDLLYQLGAISITFQDAEDQPIYEPKPGATKIWKLTRIIGLFSMEIDLDLVKSEVFSKNPNAKSLNWQLEILPDQDWENAWLEYYQAMKFGNKLWVCPTGQEQDETNTICLTLDPGLAFGTGTHATTALCLEWLALQNFSGMTVIDYGCGSGILAVAAVLLGARHAHAIDIDPQALLATQNNAEKNAVQDRITTWSAEEYTLAPADIVIANILANPLIELSQQISNLILPNGSLILSGILTTQIESVIAAYEETIAFSHPVSQDEWCRLDGIRR